MLEINVWFETCKKRNIKINSVLKGLKISYAEIPLITVQWWRNMFKQLHVFSPGICKINWILNWMLLTLLPDSNWITCEDHFIGYLNALMGV